MSDDDLGDLGDPDGPDVVLCSAKGCTAAAVWGLEWNNPRLHTPERRKVWAACEQHRGSLSDFLASRAFLRDVVAIADARAV